MALVGLAVVVKAAIIMFYEHDYWEEVASRLVRESVVVKPNRGNILSTDGQLMASSLPEYKIYLDYLVGERNEKKRMEEQAKRDSRLIWILSAGGFMKSFPIRVWHISKAI